MPSRKARKAKADASPVHATAMAATGASVVSALCVMTDRSPPDPLNPQAAVPALLHTSAFAAYRRDAEVEPIGWRAANNTVARIGGWRAYAREAAAAAPAPAPGPAASASKP